MIAYCTVPILLHRNSCEVKALCDVSQMEQLSRERWSAVKWVMNQLRILCDNKYQPAVEPGGLATVISHDEFFNMVRPAFWEQAEETDIMAIFKRAVIIINTEKWIYVRLATERKVSILRVKAESYDFLRPECKDRLKLWKEGNKELPVDHAEAKKWEAQWVKEQFSKPTVNPDVVIVDTHTPAHSMAPLDDEFVVLPSLGSLTLWM